MNGKGLWVRTFLVAVGILATMGMNINRIHTIGGFDNAAENNTHLLDGSYESGGLLDGSMERMPYNLGNSFDVRNDSITNSYIRDSIDNTMDLSQVMDMESEISRFKREVAPTSGTNGEGDSLLNIQTEQFKIISNAFTNLATSFKSLRENIKLLDFKDKGSQNFLRLHLNDLKSMLKIFNSHNGFGASFSTLERRQNLKTITFDLVNIINTVNSKFEAYKASTEYKFIESIETYANDLFELSMNTLVKFMSKLQNECKNHEGNAVDYFKVSNFTCNPTCGTAIDPNVTDLNFLTSEYSESNKGMLTLYNKDDKRCDDIRKFYDICDKSTKDGINLVQNYANGTNTDNSEITNFIQSVTQANEELYSNLKDESWCLALDSCCVVRKFIKNLSIASLKIDKKYGIEGSNAPDIVSADLYKSIKKLSNSYKDMILKLLTKIGECRTHSVSNENDITKKKSETPEAPTTTVSTDKPASSETGVITDKPASNKSNDVLVNSDESEDAVATDKLEPSENVAVEEKPAPPEIGVVTDKPASSETGVVTSNPASSEHEVVANQEGNYISGNNFTSVGDVQTNNTQLKNDSRLQSTDGSSSDKTENVAASGVYLHSSAASNTLISSLFILIATLLQRFQ